MARRPADVKPPAYLTPSPPVPEPDPKPAERTEDRSATDHLGLDPTRYGDWELKGVAIDF